MLSEASIREMEGSAVPFRLDSATGKSKMTLVIPTNGRDLQFGFR